MRIGAVTYLNTKPLVHHLLKSADEQEVVFDLPSRLADRLAHGELDVALIPSIEYLREPTYRIVSDACIACRGPVMSVKLFSRVPFANVRTLALDEGSRTSVAMSKILLRARHALQPETVGLPIDQAWHSLATDAVLLIGDRAMRASHPDFPYVWDLGDEWCRWAELPFVFAVWTARGDVETGDLAETLAAARDRGLADLPRIAAVEGPRLGLDPSSCLKYFTRNLHFQLGPRERQGLQRFANHAAEIGEIPRRRETIPHDPTHP